MDKFSQLSQRIKEVVPQNNADEAMLQARLAASKESRDKLSKELREEVEKREALRFIKYRLSFWQAKISAREEAIQSQHTSVYNNMVDMSSITQIQAEQMEAEKQLQAKTTAVIAKSKTVKQSLTEQGEQMKAQLAKLVKSLDFLQEKCNRFTSGSVGAGEVREKITETKKETKLVLKLIEEDRQKQFRQEKSIEERSNGLSDIKSKTAKVETTIDELKKKLCQSSVNIFEHQVKMVEKTEEMQKIFEKKNKEVEAIHQIIVKSKELDVKIAEVERSNLEEKARLREEREQSDKSFETEKNEIAMMEKELESVQKRRDELKEKLNEEEVAEKNRIHEKQAKKKSGFNKSENSFLNHDQTLMSETYYSDDNIRQWIEDTNYQSEVSNGIEFPSALNTSGGSTSSRNTRKTRRTRVNKSNKKPKLIDDDIDCEVTSTYHGDRNLKI